MKTMLEEFVGESRELLEKANQAFLELEHNPGDQVVMNRLFRAVHTIKGASGLFDVAPLTKLVHAAEDLLDAVRGGEIAFTPEMVDLLLASTDQISSWLDALEDDGTLPADAESLSQEMTQRLRSHLPASEQVQVCAAPVLIAREPADWIGDVPQAKLREIYRDAASRGLPLATVTYQPGEHCFFSGDDPLFTALQAPGLLWIGGRSVAPWPATVELDPFLCNLRFHLLCQAPVEELGELFRYVEQEVEIGVLDPSDLVRPQGETGRMEALEEFAADAAAALEKRAWAELAGLVALAADIISADMLSGSALGWLKEALALPEPDPTLVAHLLAAVETGEWPSEPFVVRPATHDEEHIDPQTDARVAAIEVLQTQIKMLSTPAPADVRRGRVASVAQTLTCLFDALELTALANRTRGLDLAGPVEQIAARLIELSGEGLRRIGRQGGGELDHRLSHASTDLLTAQLEMLATDCPSAGSQGRIASVVAVLTKVFSALALSDLEERAATVLAQAWPQGDLAPLRGLIEEALIRLRQGLPTVSAPGREAEIITQPTSEPEGRPTAAAAEQPEEGSSGAIVDAGAKRKIKTLKVEVGRVDTLMDLVGELVVAKNALPFLARRAEEKYAARGLSREIRSQYAVINRLAEELQAAVMQVRMVALSSVFQRFPRMVRDLARKQGKDIHLVLEGEETEADKNVVEELAEPLVHLIRNAIDHGIEAPEERAASGKPAQAEIRLAARQNQDRVEVSVSDDGRGIDPQLVKRKAYEKGIIGEDLLERISDQDAMELVFAPGLSTAEQISDLSGRGVGMDVVRTMVLQLGGRISLDSRLGEGSRVTLSLPLSMAVSRVMMFQVGHESYAVPLDQITETVLVPRERIHRIKQREALLLRGRLLPLYRLSEALNVPTAQDRARDEEYVLVVRVDGGEAGLVVDRFTEDIDVILKPLEGVVAGLSLFSGTALLGDGRVLLVLDAKELLRCR